MVGGEGGGRYRLPDLMFISLTDRLRSLHSPLDLLLCSFLAMLFVTNNLSQVIFQFLSSPFDQRTTNHHNNHYLCHLIMMGIAECREAVANQLVWLESWVLMMLVLMGDITMMAVYSAVLTGGELWVSVIVPVVSSTTAILGNSPVDTELYYPQLLPGVLLAGHLTTIISRGVAALARSRLLDRVVNLLGFIFKLLSTCVLFSSQPVLPSILSLPGLLSEFLLLVKTTTRWNYV